MFSRIKNLSLGLLLLSASSLAQATPLSLAYSITDTGGGVYQYDFTLTLDNNDGSWLSGGNFNWITVGDCESCTSPLTDWNWLTTSVNVFGDDSSLELTSSWGYHNGPTLLDQTGGLISTAGWIPTSVGETLMFSGTSTAFLGAGELLFSNLLGNGGAYANFEVASFISSVPEPAGLSLLLVGLAGLRFVRKPA